MKKKFYFIRSKIDNNIRAAERRKKDKDQTLQEIRQDCIKNLKELNIQSPKVFLVSAPELHLYDFHFLCETLELDLPELQRDALLLALLNISLNIITKKKNNIHTFIVFTGSSVCHRGRCISPWFICCDRCRSHCVIHFIL
ncbi:hypothetical protein NL108_014968 [Boleophthalmus pectinirostris]|nr:hypothetical protein NL108_014968 [Boleophthalmus pectinirostris]